MRLRNVRLTSTGFRTECYGNEETNSHEFFCEKKILGSQSAAIESRVWRNIGMHILVPVDTIFLVLLIISWHK